MYIFNIVIEIRNIICYIEWFLNKLFGRWKEIVLSW